MSDLPGEGEWLQILRAVANLRAWRSTPKTALHQPLRLANLDHGDDCAILLESGEGPARIKTKMLRHRELHRSRRPSHLGAISSRIRSPIRYGPPFRECSKSNDDFSCSLTIASDIIERLPDFFQIWRFGAQPV
jgi:hypothetical protein